MTVHLYNSQVFTWLLNNLYSVLYPSCPLSHQQAPYPFFAVNNLTFFYVILFTHFLVHRMMGEVMSCIKGQVRVSSIFNLGCTSLDACLTFFHHKSQNYYHSRYNIIIFCYIIHFYLQVLTIPDFLKLFCSLAAVSINSNDFFYMLILISNTSSLW